MRVPPLAVKRPGRSRKETLWSDISIFLVVGAVCNRDLLTVSRRQKYEGFHPKPGRRIDCRYSEIEIFPAFKGLQDRAERRPLIGNVRGRGLAIGIELVKDKGSREPAPVENRH